MKNKTIQFRVPEKDKDEMVSIAKDFGEDLSSWVRRAVYMEMRKAKTISKAFDKAKERMEK